ncbi:MAG: response regulator [Planctomycetota bacterium]
MEDDPSHAELFRLAISESNAANSLDHVEGGKQAAQYLQGEGMYADRRRPDVILLDVHIPKMNGHEVLRFIKSSPELSTTPVVMLTTSDTEIDRAQAYRANVNSYLTKPVDLDQFQKMISDLESYWSTWNSSLCDSK